MDLHRHQRGERPATAPALVDLLEKRVMKTPAWPRHPELFRAASPTYRVRRTRRPSSCSRGRTTPWCRWRKPGPSWRRSGASLGSGGLCGSSCSPNTRSTSWLRSGARPRPTGGRVPRRRPLRRPLRRPPARPLRQPPVRSLDRRRPGVLSVRNERLTGLPWGSRSGLGTRDVGLKGEAVGMTDRRLASEKARQGRAYLPGLLAGHAHHRHAWS